MKRSGRQSTTTKKESMTNLSDVITEAIYLPTYPKPKKKCIAIYLPIYLYPKISVFLLLPHPQSRPLFCSPLRSIVSPHPEFLVHFSPPPGEHTSFWARGR